jgi:GT2 family glycosyltransferase
MSETVGVVVMDFDQQACTRRCLSSLVSGSRRPDLVVLVENGRAPFDIAGEPALADLPLVVLRPDRNLGCSGGRNLGLSYLARNTSLTRFVIFDNDVVVPPGFIEQIASTTLERLEVCAPVIYDFNTGEVWSSGGSIGPDGAVSVLTDQPARDEASRQVDWSPGACLIMARDTWVCIGEFDPWMAFLFEDVEWCLRLRAAGGRVRVDSDLQLRHEAHQSLGGRDSPQRAYLWTRNGTVFRMSVVRVGLRPLARWLGTESALAMLDLVRGQFPYFMARIAGLVAGLANAARRRGYGRALPPTFGTGPTPR